MRSIQHRAPGNRNVWCWLGWLQCFYIGCRLSVLPMAEVNDGATLVRTYQTKSYPGNPTVRPCRFPGCTGCGQHHVARQAPLDKRRHAFLVACGAANNVSGTG